MYKKEKLNLKMQQIEKRVQKENNSNIWSKLEAVQDT